MSFKKISASLAEIFLYKNVKITSIKEILDYYQKKFSKTSEKKIGVEWERFGIKRDKKTNKIIPAPYIDGYENILNAMNIENKWEVVDRYDDHIFTLKKNTTLITTEGDGKPEISGSAFTSLHDVFLELETISEEIEKISKKEKISWVETGLQPYNKVSDLPLAPKPRYQTFLNIAEKKGYVKWMSMYMKAVSGVHINIDVNDEHDLIQKLQTCFRIAPILCGLFANSPMEEGKPTSFLSTRRKYISCEKCERSHMMEGILDKKFSLEKWIQWYIDQPMLVIIRGKETIITPDNFSFARWMKEGFEGIYPTIEDFDVHLKTLWVDTRFRVGYLEFRPLDTLPLEYLQGAVSLFTGILYSKNGYQTARELTENWEEKNYRDIHEQAWNNGIHAEYKGVKFLDAGKKLVELAKKTLQERNLGEEKFLDSVEFLLQNKTTPAEIFLEKEQLKK